MSDTEKVTETEPEAVESKSEEEPVSDTAPKAEDDGGEEKKEPASNGRKRKKPATPSAPRQGARKSARASAAVQHYDPTVTKPAGRPGRQIVLGEGEGTELKNIPNVAKSLKKYKSDELKSVHNLLVGKPGKKLGRKRAIGQFNGFSNDSEEARDTLTTKLTKMTLKQLKFFCTLFDVEKPKDKDELVLGLVEFLYKPAPSGRKIKTPTKRPLAPFFEFSRLEREGVKERLDDAGVAEVAKELGRMWGKLSQKQKESYRSADAPKPKKKAAKKKATKKKAAKKKKPASSEEESEEEGSDDDEDEFREKLSRSISKIIEETEELTKRKVMDALKKEYEEDLVVSNKQLIKDIIKEQTDTA